MFRFFSRFRSSITATAFVLAAFVLLDLWLVFCHPLANVPTASLERGEVANSMRAYASEKGAPDLVILGSSLVTAPIMQAETAFLNRPIARFRHRRSSFLEKALADRLGRQPSVFCLAVGGEMASDAYLIAKEILCSGKRPIAIAYGIAPRDFQDNLLPGIESTETFQTQAQLDDLPDFIKSPHLTLEKKADLILGRIWSLWRYKSDIRVYLVLRMKKLMEKGLPFVVFDKYGETADLKPRRKGQFPEEAKGTPTAWPGVPLEHYPAEKSRLEYIRRYNPLNHKLIDEEFGYFARLLRLCRDTGTPVLVFNMPLSRLNKSLMPEGFYKDYLVRTKSLCSAYGGEFVDLDLPNWDSDQNFVDGVHLTPEVSPRFVQLLAECTARSQVSLAIKSASRAVASRNAHSF